ncbi:MAG: hypothetical protein AB7V16_11450 [Vulcanibacillus sp.]
MIMFKIGFITNDSELISGFRNEDHFQNFNIFNKLSELENTDLDVVVISDKLVSFNDLINYDVNIKYVFYLVSNENYTKSYTDVLTSKGYIYVPPKLTTRQIIENITSKLLQNVKSVNNNVICFFGADNKVGTTMISYSVAEKIAEDKKLNVLLLFLDGKQGCDYTQNVNFYGSLDNMKIKLFNRILSISELKETAVNVGTLSVLKGTSSLTDRRHYHPEHIEYLIDLASKYYDVIIIDAGSNIELGMTIGALNASSLKFLISDQNEKTITNFNYINDQALLKLDIKDFLLIVNKCIDNPYLLQPNQISTLLNSPLFCTINYEEVFWQSDKEKKSLIKYNKDNFNKSINKITSLIGFKVGYEHKDEDKEKYNIFKKLFKKIG